MTKNLNSTIHWLETSHTRPRVGDRVLIANHNIGTPGDNFFIDNEINIYTFEVNDKKEFFWKNEWNHTQDMSFKRVVFWAKLPEAPR